MNFELFLQEIRDKNTNVYMDIYKNENSIINFNGRELSCLEVEDPDNGGSPYLCVSGAEIVIKKIVTPSLSSCREDFEILGEVLGFKSVDDVKTHLRYVEIEGNWAETEYEASVLAIKQNGRFYILPHELDDLYAEYRSDSIRNYWMQIAQKEIDKEMERLEISGLKFY